ncbi:Rne/Rng family ribonuclease [Chitinilyticum piscinae]|uniref:Ribonuclease E n=1 Tax=Chitinilyticum piscinae TaxID=2866724 RepID=A0A8J7K9R6_9NEIS|nr:Rne/Rng family ribonuclease [Chitinilyticum piscinae]MBE9608554.1 Rne/Rng family ribonuclease [Chitinilyticum piscinae]
MKRMLFNATQAEELRVAIVDGQKLIDLDIETVGKEQRKSNIYKGVITRIEPSLEACFVDYGCDRHGFLPFKEISRAYLGDGEGGGRGRVLDSLKEGQELIVQVEKDERGNKGAALTTYISLAGRYLVLMPNNPRGGGVSRRIEGEERNELRAAMDQLDTPSGMSLIARTAAIGRAVEELQWDFQYLLQLWRAIEGAATSQTGAFLIYQESSLVIRAIRDYFQPEIGEILIDKSDIFEQARQFMSHVMPGNVNRVKLYQDDVPLFSRFQIEHQIETAFAREVSLPSGGAIVIDKTEALYSIDVNSARATKGSDIEETALRTNLEAADEIARQMRLRDVGGLIVIDFIDMENPKSQRDVENRLREALHHDRARVQTGKISRFGLMELSRQRLQPSLEETTHIACPRCHGTGFIRGTESSALHILRIIQEDAMKDNTGAIHAQVPVDVATFLLNEKRHELFALEARLKVSIVLIPNMHMETPDYSVSRLRHDELNQFDDGRPSYRMVETPPEQGYQPLKAKEEQAKRQEAAVKGITPAQPAPVSAEPRPAKKPAAAQEQSGTSLWSRIVSWFKGEPAVEETKPAARNSGRRNDSRRRGERNGERNERNERGERNEQRAERGNRGNDENRRSGKPRIEEDQKPAREGRGERNRERNNGNDSRETAALASTATAPAEAPAKQEGRRERQPRSERQPRGERNTAPKQEELLETSSTATGNDNTSEQIDANSAAPAGEASEGRSRRRRGRRGGERRGERNAAAEVTTEAADAVTSEEASTIPVTAISDAAQANAAPVIAVVSEVASAPAAEAADTSAATADQPATASETAPDATAEAAPAVATEASTPIPQTESVPAQASLVFNAEAPAAAAAPAEKAAAAPGAEATIDSEPQVDAAELAAQAGLVLVSTSAASSDHASEAAAPTRRRRSDIRKEGQAAAASEQVELQLVQTSASNPAAEEIIVEAPKRRRRSDQRSQPQAAPSAAPETLAQVSTGGNSESGQ